MSEAKQEENAHAADAVATEPVPEVDAPGDAVAAPAEDAAAAATTAEKEEAAEVVVPATTLRKATSNATSETAGSKRSRDEEDEVTDSGECVSAVRCLIRPLCLFLLFVFTCRNSMKLFVLWLSRAEISDVHELANSPSQ